MDKGWNMENRKLRNMCRIRSTPYGSGIGLAHEVDTTDRKLLGSDIFHGKIARYVRFVMGDDNESITFSLCWPVRPH